MSANDDLLLSISGLRISVGDTEILRGVDVTCGRGEIVSLVGESGSGKSMTLRSVIGLVPSKAVTTGSVLVEGRQMVNARRADLDVVRRSRAAMVFQDPRSHISPFQSIETFMTEGLRVHGRQGRVPSRRVAAALLDEVGLSDPERILRRHPHELSGGMLQRVMIATALAAEPALLLADEPTTALDVTTQAEIVSIFRRLRETRGLAIVLVTHDLELAAATSDRISVMNQGEIVESGAAETVARLRPAKPIVALVAGRHAPKLRRMGHAGAFTTERAGSAAQKIDALRAAGVQIAPNARQVGEMMRNALAGV